MERINEGAEAIIFHTSLLGSKAILKRRIKKEYRIKEIDSSIRTARSKNEARIIAIASRAGIKSPKLLLSDGYDIYMTEVDGTRMDLYLKRNPDDHIFAPIGALLGGLHNTNISHGDYTPANIIVKQKTPYIIDFGLSQISDSVEAKALDILLMKRSINTKQYGIFISSYKEKSIAHKDIIKRLEAIERRGRYQTRTLSAK